MLCLFLLICFLFIFMLIVVLYFLEKIFLMNCFIRFVLLILVGFKIYIFFCIIVKFFYCCLLDIKMFNMIECFIDVFCNGSFFKFIGIRILFFMLSEINEFIIFFVCFWFNVWFCVFEFELLLVFIIIILIIVFVLLVRVNNCFMLFVRGFNFVNCILESVFWLVVKSIFCEEILLISWFNVVFWSLVLLIW